MSEGDLDSEGCGCCLFGFLAVAALVLTVVSSCAGYSGERSDDPYFHRAHCSPPVGSVQPEQVVITSWGVSQRCVETVRFPVVFVDRLTDRPVTLCLGRAGVCASGHRSPFPGERLTLHPGESGKIDFPAGTVLHGWFSFGRTYPVTVTPVPGMPTSTGFDVVVRVRSQDPPSSP
ncbi:hypothetical protein GCM10023196_031230 [Actinoallomurus vinaceus]|uniref:Lipoprotein n=1 Tax=Actinoallomurus vinaceus TaxID=1080074 RepID=A0ABP8UAX5_9ACTN